MTDIADIMAKAILGAMVDTHSRQAAKCAQAALTALQESGYVVVPVVPTEEMHQDDSVALFYWSRMLAASPGSSGGKEPRSRTVGEPGENMGIGISHTRERFKGEKE